MSDSKSTFDPNKFGYIKNGKVFRKAFGAHEDLEIGIVRESDEQSIQYFVNRFDSLSIKVNELKEAVNKAVNKGSFLMKILHMKEKIPEFKGIGDFVALLNTLDKIEEKLQENIAQNRVKNLEIKSSLLQSALELKDSKDWEETAEKMKELRLNWVRTGAVIGEKQDEMEDTFHNTVNSFFDAKKKFKEEKKRIVGERSKRYKYLISEVKKLSYEKDKEVILRKISRIKKDWEGVGEVPEKMMKPLELKLSRSIQELKSPIRRRRIGQVESNRTSYPNRPQQGSPNRRPPTFQKNELEGDELKKLIEEKNKLLVLSQELKDLPLKKAVSLAKELQEKWLKSGRTTAPEIRTIYNKFREIIALIFERNALEIEIDKKYPELISKGNAEKKNVRIATLREMIRRDKSEIKLFEDNLNQLGVMENPNPQTQALISKLRGQKFRVKIKDQLLNDIELH